MTSFNKAHQLPYWFNPMPTFEMVFVPAHIAFNYNVLTPRASLKVLEVCIGPYQAIDAYLKTGSYRLAGFRSTLW
jgi:hypothetical protein